MSPQRSFTRAQAATEEVTIGGWQHSSLEEGSLAAIDPSVLRSQHESGKYDALAASQPGSCSPVPLEAYGEELCGTSTDRTPSAESPSKG